LGREKEALRLYTAELKKKPGDAGAVAVASNNVLSINRDQNIFESKKKIKTMNVDGLNYKVTSGQRRTMLANQCLYYLATNQVWLV
jgi:signal recognition particle subunit SRP72